MVRAGLMIMLYAYLLPSLEINMTVEPWDSDVELEVQERAREIEAVGGALLNNARTLVGIHFDSAFQNDPAVIASVFQGLVALHGPVK